MRGGGLRCWLVESRLGHGFGGGSGSGSGCVGRLGIMAMVKVNLLERIEKLVVVVSG